MARKKKKKVDVFEYIEPGCRMILLACGIALFLTLMQSVVGALQTFSNVLNKAMLEGMSNEFSLLFVGLFIYLLIQVVSVLLDLIFKALKGLEFTWLSDIVMGIKKLYRKKK